MKKITQDQIKKKTIQWKEFHDRSDIMAREIFLDCYDNGLEIPADIMKAISEIIRKDYKLRRITNPNPKKRNLQRDLLLFDFVNFLLPYDRSIAQSCAFFLEILKGRNYEFEPFNTPEMDEMIAKIRNLKIEIKDMPKKSTSLEQAYQRMK